MNRQDAKDAKKEEREEPSAELDRMAHQVIGAAIEVHRFLGPGFLESVYEEALCIELSLQGIPFARQVPSLVSQGCETQAWSRDHVQRGRSSHRYQAGDSCPLNLAPLASWRFISGATAAAGTGDVNAS